MAITNRDRVGKALDLLKAGLAPYVKREFTNVHQAEAESRLARFKGDDRMLAGKEIEEWDVAALLKLMWDSWNEVFRLSLGHAERSLVSELREARNRWAHQQPFSGDDTYRVLDSVSRLLTAVSAPQVEELEKIKNELLRVRFAEQERLERRKSTATGIESRAVAGLKPWREVVTPHRDVASGRYQQAEFAADLWQVHMGEGGSEYRDPVEFFRRTYLTESLKRLLISGMQRLSGAGGDPVVQLQTNFGGGKTHSMLALYHLVSGVAPGDLPGIESLLEEAGLEKLPRARRVVLVGNKISPGNPMVKPDGTEVRTLWGELAWQLGGRKAYDRIRADDERATSPGDTLRELMNEYGPCLILIDEWVAYARQLHGESDLPGGSFETQFSFAQVLTESAKLAHNCLLLVSLPASDTAQSAHATADDVEVGGQRGREALSRLRNVIGRVESSWRPASAEEGFEIVRRRLFEPLVEREQYVARDRTAREFFEFYKAQQQEFPPECRESEYERRLQAAYPIHPEIFDRLYSDWSTLVKFQRTRGVLRLMAAVIHSLWEKGDKNPLILPASLPIDDQRVQFELTRYLSDVWPPIIEKDVDGPNALPLRIDGEIPNLGKYSACRRVARTIYLGSAPSAPGANRGIEDRQVKLGCLLPGESPAIFGDAMRRLSAAATYLYQDGPRYWYDTQPTVTKLAEDRAAELRRNPEALGQELEKRLREDLQERGDFGRVHPLPHSGQDVPDDHEARLVVLGAEYPCSRAGDSPAHRAAATILESRGTSPRIFGNTLVFLAPDETRLQDLEEALAHYLAWISILAEQESLNLSPHQVKQAQSQKNAADGSVKARLPETYQWLLVPTQKSPRDTVSWLAFRLSGQEPLAVRAAKKLRREELLLASLGGIRLRMELDRVPLWRGNHVGIGQLVDDFASYLYLPRLFNPRVLYEAIEKGLATLLWDDTFAYAENYDESADRYLGLRAGQNTTLADGDDGLLVRPEIARRQIEEETLPPETPTPGPESEDEEENGGEGGTTVAPPPPPPPPVTAKAVRFYGSADLDATRVGRDAGQIAEEVISHLTGLVGSQVTVTLEITAESPEGFPDQVVRIVTENARTLKFTNHGFESNNL